MAGFENPDDTVPTTRLSVDNVAITDLPAGKHRDGVQCKFRGPVSTLEFCADCQIQSETELIAATRSCSVTDVSPTALTGLDVNGLVRIAAAVLQVATADIPTGELLRTGGFNRIYRLQYPLSGHDIIVRIPLPQSRQFVSVSTTVASMLFAQTHLGIPIPRILAWNHDDLSDNEARLPYILMEFVTETFEAWSTWHKDSGSERHCRILAALAKTHALFLRPLKWKSLSIGELLLQPEANDSHALRPIRSRVESADHTRLKVPVYTANSTDLPDVWLELWNYHLSQCLQYKSEETVDLHWNSISPHPQLVPRADFLEVADGLRTIFTAVLKALDLYPNLCQPCLARNDYAFRNVLLDPDTLDVKACIDFDDVQVMPFILSPIFPKDILTSDPISDTEMDKRFVADGGFVEFPLDEYGPPSVLYSDENGDIIDGVGESNQRIQDTAYRTAYFHALAEEDERFRTDEWWPLHKDARKVHTLLTGGVEDWWVKREWLRTRAGEV
ncbi:hypothetical protein EXIGLDRAFT_830767 [Exidia glandulosa HHB12029]|uniref:Aminoglycoside phosphotransferase domain-containing protein n=1 Tax=Exidia glandulosa HHB12029 TaxID=1314781 RepID=A0A165N844_EXIGL|nr:hypothetical protein EXIGLDRAFT_830767 [Exidia glandulosa HHB12029]